MIAIDGLLAVALTCIHAYIHIFSDLESNNRLGDLGGCLHPGLMPTSSWEILPVLDLSSGRLVIEDL